nr:hypothetical protein [Spirochaetaceae bacterium]
MKKFLGLLVGLLLVLFMSCDTGSSSDTPVVDDTPAAALYVPSADAAAAITVAAVADGWTRYEAEDADVTDGSDEVQDFYSEGTAAGSLNTKPAAADVDATWSNISCVKFSLTGITAGDYTLRFAYNGDDDKTILVKVNDDTNREVSLPAVAGNAWDQLITKDGTATFVEGDNSVWISAPVDDTGWANIDY